MTAALLEEEQFAVDAVDEAPAVCSVVYRPEAVDLSTWPKEGPWSRVRRDPKTGAGVPVLRVPDLSRRAYQRLGALAVARGLANKGELHLIQWNQDRVGPCGQIGWGYEDMTDYAQHYADYTTTDAEGKPAGPKPKRCTPNTFWRRMGVHRHELGLTWRIEAASKGCPARYEVCVRADSPLLTDLPEDLARELRLDVLVRLLGEHEVPASNEPERGSVLSEVAELYGGAQIEPEQHADAAAVSRMGKYEVALLHARTPEVEALIARSALASSRGWADPAGRPAPPPLSEVPNGDVIEPVKPKELALPGRPLPAALRSDLSRLGSIKRTVFKGAQLAAYGPRTKMQNVTYYREGVSLTNALDFGFSDARVASGDGRTKGKAAPKARNTNVRGGSDLASGGWPVVQEGPVEALRAKLAPRRPSVDVRDGARVARRVWAMWRRERPRATWLGSWVEGSDGVATWDYGDEGWESLSRLIAECLLRVPESLILSHARGSIADNARSPLDVFAWRLHHKIMPRATYAQQADAARRYEMTRAAAHVRVADELETSAEGGALYLADRAAGHVGVTAAQSAAAAELEPARARAKAAAELKAAADAAEQAAREQAEAEARAAHRAARAAAIEAERAEMARRKAAADAALSGAVQAAAEQRAAAEAERARIEAEALAEHEAKRRGQFPAVAEHRQDDKHAQAHAMAKRDKKAKELAARKTPSAPAAAAEPVAKDSRVADRLARWASEGRVRGVEG